MTTQDKREMFASNLARGIENAHKHGLSWRAIASELIKQLVIIMEKVPT